MDSVYIPSLKSKLIPESFELLEGLGSIYELEFALAELKSLDKEELINRSAYFAKIDGKETIHHKLCAGLNLLGNNASTRLKAFFEKFQFKTGYATHGLFPYKGKFHPQLIKGLINIMKIRKGDIILDPMTGSGTTNVEASIIGLDSIGVDSNPFCVLMTKVKTEALRIEKQDLLQFSEINNLLDFFSNPPKAQIKLTEQSLFETLFEKFQKKPILRDFFLLCYLDSVAYSKRRKNKTPGDVFPVVYQRYINAIGKFVTVRDENNMRLGKVHSAEGDARDLANLKPGGINGIEDAEIDGIITSPPYYFAIDYLEEDRPQLEYLNCDIDKIRETMIGLRGEDFRTKIELFLNDIDSVFSEMCRVLKPGKLATMIIGYNTVQMQREFKALGMDLNERIVSLAKGNKLFLQKHIVRPIEGARNIMQTENIFIFKKSSN